VSTQPDDFPAVDWDQILDHVRVAVLSLRDADYQSRHVRDAERMHVWNAHISPALSRLIVFYEETIRTHEIQKARTR
jgi:hypothetical protein